MDRKPDNIAVGARFKVNKLGAARCPSLAGKVGVVVERSRTTALTVMFDGDRRPTCLHRDYVSPIPSNAETEKDS
jgi:hypothetical protein